MLHRHIRTMPMVQCTRRVAVAVFGLSHYQGRPNSGLQEAYSGLLSEVQSDVRPCRKEPNRMRIHLECTKKLHHISWICSHLVLTLLRLRRSTLGKRHGFTRLEVPKVDLLEVFLIDSGVVFMEGRKWLITCTVQE